MGKTLHIPVDGELHSAISAAAKLGRLTVAAYCRHELAKSAIKPEEKETNPVGRPRVKPITLTKEQTIARKTAIKLLEPTRIIKYRDGSGYYGDEHYKNASEKAMRREELRAKILANDVLFPDLRDPDADWPEELSDAEWCKWKESVTTDPALNIDAPKPRAKKEQSMYELLLELATGEGEEE